MKRIFTVLIAAAMLLALFAVPAAASGNARFTLTGPASARPGDTITVSLNVSGQYGAHALDMMIFFDNTSFRFKNCVNGSALDGLTGAWPLSGLHKDGNAVSFGVLMLTDPLTVQGELLKITFEVLSSASSSPVFTIGVNKFSNIPVNGSETPIPYSASDLTISINGGSGSGTTPAPAVTPKPVLTPIPKTPAPTAKPKRLYLKVKNEFQRSQVGDLLVKTPGSYVVTLYVESEAKAYQAPREWWVSERVDLVSLREYLGAANVVFK